LEKIGLRASLSQGERTSSSVNVLATTFHSVRTEGAVMASVEASVVGTPQLHWDPIPLGEIAAARERLRGIALRTPLVRLDADDVLPAGTELFLKLECLQPVRSFKLRGAYNAVAKAGQEVLSEGVWTVSSGNMAQALAWSARTLGVPCTVYVPDTVPRIKLANILRYGATPVEVPFSELVPICLTHRREGAPGRFVHPYSDPEMMAGNGTIGLELLDDAPVIDAVVVPWGGGGAICGIASAIKALRPRTKVYASEIETGAPLAASLAAGHPVTVPHTSSFVDGISAPFISPEMLRLARELVHGAIVVTRDETAAAARLIMERTRVVAEGAAATAVAAALSGRAGAGRIACIVSGGNIDAKTLVTILQGGTPA
jgi:threonine dehydratase